MHFSEDEPSVDRVIIPLSRDLLGNRQDAEDVAQDVWVLLRQQPPGRVRSLWAWLGIAIRHVGVRTRRRERRRAECERIVARPDRAPSVVEILEQGSQREFLVGLVDGLAEPYREVVRLRYLEEREIPEIAARVGHSQATVRSQIKRGLDQLRLRLGAPPSRQRRLSALLPLSWRRAVRRVDLGLDYRSAVVVGVGVCALVLWAFLGGTDASRGRLAAAGPDLPFHPPPEPLVSASDTGERVPASDAVQPAVEPLADPWETVVEGTVVDPDGHPVPNADVVIGNWDGTGSRIVASSDSLGHYRVERVDRRLVIWAEDPGRIQSFRHLIATRPAHRRLDLKLGDPIGALVGQVLSSQGVPVPGAEIVLKSGVDRFEPTGQQTLASGQQTARARTGSDGRFRLARGIQSSFWLFAQAEGHTPQFSRVTREAGPQEVVITLQPPSALQGQVIRPDGTAAAGVRLGLAFPDPWPRRETTTGEDGSFLFDSLPAAWYGLRLLGDPTGALSSCYIEGKLAAGERASLRVSLAQEQTIHGRALERGLPLAGWRVELEEREPRLLPRDLREVRTSSDGSFAFPSCQLEEAHVLRLFQPGDTSGVPLAVACDVHPGEGEIVLRPDDPESLPGSLVGRFESAGPPPVIAALRGTPFSPAMLLLVGEESGEFSAARLPPRCYELQAWIPDMGTWQAAPVTIRPGRRTELSLNVPDQGTLRIVVDAAKESDLDGWSATVDMPSFHDLGKNCVLRIPRNPGQSSFSARLFPGDYECWLKFESTEVERRHVHIEPGTTTEERLALEERVAMSLRVTSLRGPRRGEDLSLSVRTPNRQEDSFRQWGTGTIPLLLPLDTSELRVQTSFGLTGTLALAASDVAPGGLLEMRLEEPGDRK